MYKKLPHKPSNYRPSRHVRSDRLAKKFALRAVVISSAIFISILGVLNGRGLSAPPPILDPPAAYPVGSQPYSIAEYVQPTFDNSFPALAVTNNGSDSVSLYIRNGSNPYVLYSTEQLSAGSDLHEVAGLSSLSGSLAVAASGKNAVTIFSAFGPPPVNLPVGNHPQGIVVGDFNLDFQNDIATSNLGDGTVSVLATSGSTLQSAVSYPAGPNPEDIVTADFNGDGKPDLAVCNSSDNKMRVLIGNGDGTFQSPVPYAVGNTPLFLTTGDFDGNSKPDIAVANNGSNNVSVLLNNGDGTFQTAVNYPAGVGLRSLSTADFDLDGFQDLVVASRDDNTLKILINNGNGTFQAPLSFSSGAAPHAALAGEFNGDGRSDVVAVNNTAGTFSVLLNKTIPPNDNFVNAKDISGVSGTLKSTNAGASKEAGEPNHAENAGGRSVWYRYQPPSEGVATITTLGSQFDTTLGVYTGSSVNALTLIGSNDDAQGRLSRVVFRAHANTTYYIAVDGFNAAQGPLVLNWSLGTLLPNDDFDSGQILSGPSGSVTGTNVGASKELGEPNHAGVVGGTSVWYTWQANTNARITFTTEGSNFNTILAVYTGSAVSFLQQVAANDNSLSNFSCGTSTVTFDAISGTTYHIAVDGVSGSSGDINLKWGTVPPNDNFSNFVTMTGNSGTLGGTTRFASSEVGEPSQFAFGKSVWYRWQPTISGAATVNVGLGKSVFVYTGDTMGSLLSLGGSPSFTFSVTTGTTYQIAVMDSCDSSGLFTLNWNLQPPPTNDAFANATPISGETGTQNGSNVGASKEVNEPNHGLNAGGHSIWYQWQAPLSGDFTFTTLGSDFDTLLAVYTGSAVDAVSLIAGNNDDTQLVCNPTRSRVTFTAVAGTTYRIAVDGANGVAGNTFIRWGQRAIISGTGPSIVDLSGDLCLRSGGNFSFQNVPTGGNYFVSASDGSVSSQFQRYGGTGSLSPLNGNVSDIKFIQTTPTFTASGTVVINNGTLGGVSVTCANTLTSDFPNDVRSAIVSGTTGNWSAGGLWIGARYKCTPAKAGYTFSPPFSEVGGGGGGGFFIGSPAAVSITIDTNPAGLMVSVDGEAAATAPLVREWVPGSSHTIATTSPQNGTTGTQYVWNSWSDGPTTISHTVTVPASATTHTANFNTQYMLTMTFGAGGTVSPSSGFFNSGQSVPISATPNSGFIFNTWTGTGTGSFTGLTNQTNVTMNGPITQTASFLSTTGLLLALESNGQIPNQVLALDATTLLRDPFPVIAPFPWLYTSGANTRLIIFLQNFHPEIGEAPSAVVVNLVGSNNQSFDVPAEDLRPIPNTDLTQVTFRLPNNLAIGTCVIKVTAHNATTNSGTLRIKL